MLQLTPLRETRAVQDLLRREREEGQSEGFSKGEARGIRIGEIRLLQRLLGQPQTPVPDLESQSLEALDELVEELERQTR